MFDFRNYSADSKNYDDSNKLIVAKKKDEAVGITIKEFVVLKQKIYSFMVNDSSVHKK